MELVRTRSVEQSIEDTDQPGRRLRRARGPVQLTLIGIGVIIGTGIFVLTGEAAGTIAGPAISISFVLAAIVCLLAGLCYAEFASVVPVAGSAYTFSYASLGELVAWIIGWDLILELALGAATVASGWSQYFRVVITGSPWHVNLPTWIDGNHHNLVAALVVTGMVKYNHIDVKAPLSTAFTSVHQSTIATIVGYGALAGLTSVVLVLLMGQSRVFFAMSRDGLLPPVFSAVSQRFGSPYRSTIVTGIVVAAITFFFPLKTLAELVNIGTLFAFVLVALGVLFLRRTRPDLKRPFRTPL